MSLSIADYRSVANSGLSQLALLSDGRPRTAIGTASDAHVGFLQRLFNTEASRKVNIAITSDFKASLAREYGARVADEAFDAVIGKAGLTGAKLSSTLVSKTLSMADRIYASRLAPPPITEPMLTMRLEGEEAAFETKFLLSNEKTVLSDAKATLTKLHDLLSDMPTDKLALDSFKEKIGQAKEAAKALMTDLGAKRGVIAGVEKVVAALGKAVSMVDGKIEEATEVCNSNPITYKSLTDFAGKFIDAAKRAMANLAEKGDGGGYGLNALTQGQLIQTFRKEQIIEDMSKAIPAIPEGATENDTCLDPKAFVGKDFAKKVAKHCADLVMKDLKAHVVDGKVAFESVAFTKDFEKAILAEMGKILNEGNWDPIEKNVTFSLEGRSLKGKSVITPAAHMGGEMSKLYNDGGPKGYNCQSFGEAKHAVNLAHSEFSVEIDGKQQTVFSGIRHGVHAAVDIASKAEFKAANESRARETLIAAFTSNPSLVKKAIGNPNEACEFVFNSVSLLTPDFARNIFGSKHEDEKTMLKAQTEAYQSLSKKEIEVDVPNPDKAGETVKVKIKPIITTFNYGVNWGGVGGLSAIFGGWGVTKDMNAKGLIELNNQANKAIVELETEKPGLSGAESERRANTARAIRNLIRQINSIDQRKTYSSDGHEAYKMASRIAVLTYLLGGVPAWNCKSGKDRTGMMDVECKFLATLAVLGTDIPEPGAQLNAEQKMLYRNLLLQSGNHEMQKYNTGIAGYKLEGVGSITERIGDIASQRMFLGASKIVKS